MAMLLMSANFLPLFLKLRERADIVIIGGGAIASAKVEVLLPYRHHLHIIAPEISVTLAKLATEGRIHVSERAYATADVQGASLVIAATDDAALNKQIYRDAKAAGALVNVVDQPELCDVIFPAIVRRGSLQIAISSSGISPVLARLVKQQIERLLPWNMPVLMDFIKQRRMAVKLALDSIQRKRLFWQEVLEGALPEALYEGNTEQAEALFQQQLRGHAAKQNQAALYLVGAGPGNPDLITVKGIRLLSQADVVLYDRLVAPQLLSQYARTEAEKILVGKTRHHHHKTQSQIDALIEERLKAGQVVVRLKGGDPGVFGHVAEEAAIAKKLGVPYQIVPGISAANGCAAYAGVPLTERGGAQAVRYLTVYSEQVHDARFWQGLSNAQAETLVFYMSTSNRNLICQKLLELGFDPATPVLAIEQGTTPSHRESEAPLAEFESRFAQKRFASPTLLIVGDVVRWRHRHGWKEQANAALPFFPELEEEQTHAIH